MPVLRLRQAIHNFVECPVATARDYQLPAFYGCALRHFRGIAGTPSFDKFRLDAARRQNSAGFVEHATSSVSAIPGVGVVNQQCIS
jgi:hypothetical protein